MARIFPCCLAAAACCCLLLLPPPPPVQGRRPRPDHGLAAGGLFAGRRDHLQPHFDATERPEEHCIVPVRARSTWSPSAAAGSVRPELRSVPGGPDPVHHHDSPSRRPEQEQERTPSP